MHVKTLCLGVLSHGPASGYEIRKAFEDGPFSYFQEAGFGSIYPALKRLVEQGSVTFEEQPQDSRPDKKVYRITPAGRQALFDAVNGPVGEDKYRSDFLFVLYFARLLGPRHLDRLIGQRIDRLKAALAELSPTVTSPTAGSRFVCEFGRVMFEAEIAFLESRRHEMVGALIQSEAAD